MLALVTLAYLNRSNEQTSIPYYAIRKNIIMETSSKTADSIKHKEVLNLQKG